MAGETVINFGSIDIKYDNYVDMPKDKTGKIVPVGITNVRFGSGAPVCDIDVNELQEITQQQINGYDAILRSVLGITSESSTAFIKDPSVTANNSGKCTFNNRAFVCAMGKIFELSKNFYIPSIAINSPSKYKMYIIASYNENINSNSKLFKYGYVGSYDTVNNLRNAFNSESGAVSGRLGAGDDIELVDNYLLHSNIYGQDNPMETSRRCGFTYGVVTTATAPVPNNNEVVLCVGTVSGSTLVFDGINTIVTSKIEYHSHVNVEKDILSSEWRSQNGSSLAPYEAIIEVPELAKHNSTVPIVSLIPTGNSVDAKITEQDEYACISEVLVNGKTLKFICYENAPIVDLHINIKVV